MKLGFILGFIFLSCFVVFGQFFIQGKLPIPADSLVGLYHPFRDYYSESYPRGIPFKNFLTTDPIRQQYPFRYLAINEIKDFTLPLWNPYNFAGTPLLANVQSAPFYPLNILLLIVPFAYSWSILVFLQPVLMGIFMYLYLRKVGVSWIAGLFGAAAYAFSGFSVAWMEWNTIGHVALWLPLVLLSIENLVHKLSIRWIVIFILAMTSQLLAGHLQTSFYLLLLSGAYLISKIFTLHSNYLLKKKVVFSLKKLLPFVIMFTGVVLLSFIQWFPALRFIQYSARDIDLVPFAQDGWFIPYQHLAQFVAPDFFGNPTTLNYWGVWNYAELVGYVGLIPLVMAFFALFVVRSKLVLFFGGIVVLGLIFALQNPLAELPFSLSIPFLGTAQPTRLLFLVDFSLAVLAAIGLHAFERSQRKFYVPLIITASLLGLLWILVSVPQVFPIGQDMIAVAKRNLYLPSLLLVLLLAGYLVTVFVKTKKIHFLILILFLVITVLDLTRFAQKFLPFTDPAYLYPNIKALSFLTSQDGVFRVMSIDDRILPPNTSIMYGLQTVEGYDPLYLRRYGELIAAAERSKPSIEPPFGFNRIITPSNYESSLYDLMGVRYILSLSDVESDKLTKVFQEGETRVYENSEVFPRAFSVEEVIVAENRQDAIQAVFDNISSLRSKAIVEEYVGNSTFAKAEVELIAYRNNSVVVKVISQGESFIVLADSYYPSWRAATIESGKRSQDLQIFITDYNFRGVVLPAGEHTVEFYNTLL